MDNISTASIEELLAIETLLPAKGIIKLDEMARFVDMVNSEQYSIIIHAVLQCSAWGLETNPTNINVERNLENVIIPVHAPSVVISPLTADYSNKYHMKLSK